MNKNTDNLSIDIDEKQFDTRTTDTQEGGVDWTDLGKHVYGSLINPAPLPSFSFTPYGPPGLQPDNFMNQMNPMYPIPNVPGALSPTMLTHTGLPLDLHLANHGMFDAVMPGAIAPFPLTSSKKKYEIKDVTPPTTTGAVLVLVVKNANGTGKNGVLLVDQNPTANNKVTLPYAATKNALAQTVFDLTAETVNISKLKLDISIDGDNAFEDKVITDVVAYIVVVECDNLKEKIFDDNKGHVTAAKDYKLMFADVDTVGTATINNLAGTKINNATTSANLIAQSDTILQEKKLKDQINKLLKKPLFCKKTSDTSLGGLAKTEKIAISQDQDELDKLEPKSDWKVGMAMGYGPNMPYGAIPAGGPGMMPGMPGMMPGMPGMPLSPMNMFSYP